MEITIEEIKTATKEAALEASKQVTSQIEGLKSEYQAMVKDKADVQKLADVEVKMHELAEIAGKLSTRLDDFESRKSYTQDPEGNVFANELKNRVFTDENRVKMRNGEKMTFDDIALKAVSDMTRTYSATTGLRDLFADIETGIAKAPKVQPTILDFIRIGSTNSEILKWVIKTLVEGGVGQTAEAAKFSQISYKWDKEQSSAKKTTAYAKISKENLEDVEFTLQETLNELREDFLIQIATQVLSGDGTGENHSGIIPNATAFARQSGVGTLTGITMRDVLEHAYLQVRVAGKGSFRPNAVMLNPVDVTKLKSLKDSTGQYIMPLYLSNNGYDVNGIPIIENDQMTAGDFLIGDFTKFGWFNYRALTIQTYDQNEDDVLKDFLTVAGSLRAISRIKTPEKPAIVKGTFSTAITALQA